MKFRHNVIRQIRLLIRHIRYSWLFCLGRQSEKRRVSLKNLYRITNQFLRGLGVEYWLAHGTLLGYYRCGQPLDGDTDLDFGAPEKEYYKIRQAHHLLPAGYRMYDTSFNHYGPKLYIAHNGWEADIYFFKETDNHLQSYEKDPKAGYQQPFPKEFIYPLQTASFWGEATHIPHQVEKFLTHIYGYIGEDAVQDKKTGYWHKRGR